MSDDLLAKEKEFYKLNQELQLKNQDIMKEINFITYANASYESFNNTKQLCTELMMKDVNITCSENEALSTNKQLRKSSPESSKILSIENTANPEILLKKYKNLGSEATITLLKGKIDILYKKLQTIQLEYNNKCEYSKKLEENNKKLNETQVKLNSQIGSLDDIITKLQNANCDIHTRYQDLSNENIALKKKEFRFQQKNRQKEYINQLKFMLAVQDLHSLNKKIQILSKQSSNYDIRLNRSLENNEKFRTMLKVSQVEEKELRNQIRKLQEDKSVAIKILEKQQLELVQAFRKQLLLINNLKRQNVYLMASSQIHLTGEDFTKLLEWKPQGL